MTKTIETIKTPLLSEHGTYMFGKLDELDFTLAWTTDQGQKMPPMLKLKFIVTKKATKTLIGIKSFVSQMPLIVCASFFVF